MDEKKKRPPDDEEISHLEAILEYYRRKAKDIQDRIKALKTDSDKPGKN